MTKRQDLYRSWDTIAETESRRAHPTDKKSAGITQLRRTFSIGKETRRSHGGNSEKGGWHSDPSINVDHLLITRRVPAKEEGAQRKTGWSGTGASLRRKTNGEKNKKGCKKNPRPCAGLCGKVAGGSLDAQNSNSAEECSD